jgi:hypothetical protein
MRSPIEIPPFYVTLIVCTATLLALVYAEGWIWPLKAALHDPGIAPHRLTIGVWVPVGLAGRISAPGLPSRLATKAPAIGDFLPKSTLKPTRKSGVRMF